MTQISEKEMKIFKHLQNFGNKESESKMIDDIQVY